MVILLSTMMASCEISYNRSDIGRFNSDDSDLESNGGNPNQPETSAVENGGKMLIMTIPMMKIVMIREALMTVIMDKVALVAVPVVIKETAMAVTMVKVVPW